MHTVCGRGEIGRRCRLKIGFLWSAGSSPAVRTILSLLAVQALAACDTRHDDGPVAVSVIGAASADIRSGAAPIPESPRVLSGATAQGLVRFDAAGQIEPALAERWIVTEGGASYIFRLRDALWNDGTPVTAKQIVRSLSRRIGPGLNNPIAPFLSSIDEIKEMTPSVIEIRLSRPRLDLLKLFASPEMAIYKNNGSIGSGPFKVVLTSPLTLQSRSEDGVSTDDDDRGTRASQKIIFRSERTSSAITRFADDALDLLDGGTFADWPLLDQARISSDAIRIDPAAGLFGFLFTSRTGFLADAGHRTAISSAVDRSAITGSVLSSWTPVEKILPETLDSALVPKAPEWSTVPLNERRMSARDMVAAWKQPVTLRLALPAGPGATRIYGAFAASMIAIGISPERVTLNAPADLRLIDRVAPYDDARWYFVIACGQCGTQAQDAIEAARIAPTVADRAARLAEADLAMDADAAFIPIARPLRWSLVSPRLTKWQLNPRAWHPLNHLRANTN